MSNSVDLGSHKITSIKVTCASDGFLLGLVFFNKDNENAGIGNTTIIHPGYTKKMIALKKGEILCGISSSEDKDGFMNNFQFLTARLE